MNHAALPTGLGQIVSRALRQATTGIGNDQLHALETPVDEVTQKRRPPGLVFLGALTDAQDLSEALGIDSTSHQQRAVANFAGPAAPHDNAVQIKIGMLAFDAP